MSSRGEAAAGGVARLTLAPNSFPVGVQIFGQYMLIPSFQGVTFQTFLAGVNLHFQ
jgi:hypothetical protein